jgi:IMP dehydrogenase
MRDAERLRLPDHRRTANTRQGVGILTRRDLKFVDDPEATAGREVMTKHDRLVTAPAGNHAGSRPRHILNKNKVEKLLLVERCGRLAG